MRMTTQTAHEIRLASRPDGVPVPENFELAKVDVPELGPDQVLVRNTYMSVDPYMRGRMNDVPSYVPPYQVGKALDGAAIGEVIASTSDRVKVGDTVVHGYGWRDLAVVDSKRVNVVDPAAVPNVSAHLGALGMPGLTAFVGLLDIAAFEPGDTVFVSGAAGAVGSMVGQIAKLRGAARVIGSAGSAAKVAYLTDKLGFDAAFNYKDAKVRDSLRAAAPDGIDVYFDNVGGDHLTAAIGALRSGGRVAMCGAIGQYNATAPVPGPPNLALMVSKRLTLRGFIVTDHNAQMPAFFAEASQWLRDGHIVCDEHIVEGLTNAPEAFIGLLRGDNIGKMLVRL
jgi:NADPH-dependent curcumin reductase CurA